MGQAPQQKPATQTPAQAERNDQHQIPQGLDPGSGEPLQDRAWRPEEANDRQKGNSTQMDDESSRGEADRAFATDYDEIQGINQNKNA